MSNLWDREESLSEFELLEESNEDFSQQVVDFDGINDSVVENIQQEAAFELDEEDTTVIYNARLRLEQARLYEMLINHSLFDGVEADAQAIQNVQDELKEYIIYRLEILLGLKTKKVPEKQLEDPEFSQFNDVEVDFLKQLAYKGTRGASIQEGTSLQTTSSSTLNPIGKAKDTRPSLKTLANKPKQKVVSGNVKKSSVSKQTRKKPAKNNKNNPSTRAPVKSGVKPRNLTPKEIEAIAKEELTISKNRKSFDKMTAKEKVQEIARVNNKHARSKPSNSLPIPSFEQQQMKYTAQQSNNLHVGSESAKFNTMVANILSTRKQQSGE